MLFLDACATSRTPRIPPWSAPSKTVEKLGARRAFFTHICHDLGHERAESLLPPHVRLAYDGLEISGRHEPCASTAAWTKCPPDFGPCALTIGNFDGVHFGHRRILRRLKALADARGWKPSVLTFDPHPTRVVAPERAPQLMTSPERRAELMREEGIEQVLILPVHARRWRGFRRRSSCAQLLVERLGARAVLVGDNFRFGHRHAGNVAPAGGIGRAAGLRNRDRARGRLARPGGISQRASAS